MHTESKSRTERRHELLREMLTKLRDETYERISDFRRGQRNSTMVAGDEMDVARSSTDVATSASLIERAEDRLRNIDEAIARLDRGKYGTCAECGESIPVERLMAVPFAITCVDCQQKRNSRGRAIPSYDQAWATPAGESEEPATPRAAAAEDDSPIHDSPFGPDDEDEGGQPPAATKRRRGRPRKQ